MNKKELATYTNFKIAIFLLLHNFKATSWFSFFTFRLTKPVLPVSLLFALSAQIKKNAEKRTGISLPNRAYTLPTQQ